MLDGVEYGVFRNLVEHDAARLVGSQAQHLVEMPSDGLALAVLIGCEPHYVGTLGRLLEFGHQSLLVFGYFVNRLKIAVRLD